jgi:hypothetical protein
MHHDTANLFNDVAGDRDVRVVIYTGIGENFNANGPASIHSELAFLCDIVLASEDAWFQDRRISRATSRRATGSRTSGRSSWAATASATRSSWVRGSRPGWHTTGAP